MNFEFHLPLWAILYCGLIYANGLMTIIISNNKTPIYILSQLLSTAFMISFFFIYYGAVTGVDDKSLYILMICFILFQEIWINKPLYRQLLLEQIPPPERTIVMTSIIFVMLLFLSPLFYIIFSLL